MSQFLTSMLPDHKTYLVRSYGYFMIKLYLLKQRLFGCKFIDDNHTSQCLVMTTETTEDSS